MACADVDMHIQAEDDSEQRGPQEEAVLQFYQATETIPDKKRPLSDLMKKQPAVLGSLQIMSGLFSVGVGIVFAVSLNIQDTFSTMFRLFQLTGVLFIFSGLVSNLLFKYPALITVSLVVNCSCIIVAVVGACLISVDLAQWKNSETLTFELWKMGVLEFCVLGLELFLSAVLCIWVSKEKRAKSP